MARECDPARVGPSPSSTYRSQGPPKKVSSLSIRPGGRGTDPQGSVSFADLPPQPRQQALESAPPEEGKPGAIGEMGREGHPTFLREVCEPGPNRHPTLTSPSGLRKVSLPDPVLSTRPGMGWGNTKLACSLCSVNKTKRRPPTRAFLSVLTTNCASTTGV